MKITKADVLAEYASLCTLCTSDTEVNRTASGTTSSLLKGLALQSVAYATGKSLSRNDTNPPPSWMMIQGAHTPGLPVYGAKLFAEELYPLGVRTVILVGGVGRASVGLFAEVAEAIYGESSFNDLVVEACRNAISFEMIDGKPHLHLKNRGIRRPYLSSDEFHYDMSKEVLASYATESDIYMELFRETLSKLLPGVEVLQAGDEDSSPDSDDTVRVVLERRSTHTGDNMTNTLALFSSVPVLVRLASKLCRLSEDETVHMLESERTSGSFMNLSTIAERCVLMQLPALQCRSVMTFKKWFGAIPHQGFLPLDDPWMNYSGIPRCLALCRGEFSRYYSYTAREDPFFEFPENFDNGLAVEWGVGPGENGATDSNAAAARMGSVKRLEDALESWDSLRVNGAFKVCGLPGNVTYRAAEAHDASGIAAVHTKSWQLAYRGTMTDDFLFNELPQHHRIQWSERFQGTGRGAKAAGPEGMFVYVATNLSDDIVGFTAVTPGIEREYGLLLDNLHVLPSFRRRGIASKLVEESLEWCARVAPTETMHLTCFDNNETAKSFYVSAGGKASEPFAWSSPDGNHYQVLRYTWPIRSAKA